MRYLLTYVTDEEPETVNKGTKPMQYTYLFDTTLDTVGLGGR